MYGRATHIPHGEYEKKLDSEIPGFFVSILPPPCKELPLVQTSRCPSSPTWQNLGTEVGRQKDWSGRNIYFIYLDAKLQECIHRHSEIVILRGIPYFKFKNVTTAVVRRSFICLFTRFKTVRQSKPLTKEYLDLSRGVSQPC